MTDPLYAIDTANAALIPLPDAPAQVPTLATYTFRQPGSLYIGQPVQQWYTNFAQEQAVLCVTGRVDATANTSFDYNELDLRINGTSFLAQGSPTVFKTNTFGGLTFPLWTATDMSNPPVIPANGTLTAAVTHVAQNVAGLTIDLCLVPASQVPFLGSI